MAQKSLPIAVSALALACTFALGHSGSSYAAADTTATSGTASGSNTGDTTATRTGTVDRSKSPAENSPQTTNSTTYNTSGSTPQSSVNDVDLTRKIRSALLQANDLSELAHNILIVSDDGKVLLRGYVNSESEQKRVEAIAKQYAGSVNVTNETNVKK